MEAGKEPHDENQLYRNVITTCIPQEGARKKTDKSYFANTSGTLFASLTFYLNS